MDEDCMVVSDGNGVYTHTTLKNSRLSAKRNNCKRKVLPVVAGCLGLVFVATLVAVAVFRTTSVPPTKPNTPKDSRTSNLESITLRALFSTDYTPDADVQSRNVKNLNSLSNQLNAKLDGDDIRILDAVFSDQNLIEGLTCPNALSGMSLEWQLVTFYSPSCAAQNKDRCKEQFQKQLKNKLAQLLSSPITIEYDENSFATLNMRICSLTEITQESSRKIIRKIASMPNRRPKSRLVTYPMVVNQPPPQSRNEPNDYIASYVPPQDPSCSMAIGRITLVQMAGELESRIQDDTRMQTSSMPDYYQRFRTVTVYENMGYQLQVQLACNQRVGRDSTEQSCDLAQDINAWIDFNNNEYDDGESRILLRTNVNGRTVGNMYDLEIFIPTVDERVTLSGPHRLRLTVTPSDEYKRNCGNNDYKETRDYTVIIASRRRPVEVTPANIIYTDDICRLNSARISLVLMAGQKGSEIRDDKPSSTQLNDYQNQHHLAVTLFENTIYLIRIQLDCNWQLDKELFEKGCNLAQDVNVWIDLNNDGRYDESEIGAPYRWPVTSYLPEGIYDLQMRIPAFSAGHLRTGRYRMRLTAMSSDHYRRTCGRVDYEETREYYVNIISKSDTSVPTDVATVDPRLLKNIVCSSQVGKILRIYMPGEHRTQIRDEVSERHLWNNAYYTQQPIVLYQDHIYLLRIQLDCSRQWNDQTNGYNCQLIYHVNAWIDLNDDGRFDQSENVSPYRWPINSYTPQGNYDLQIYTPVIDTRVTKHGPHRMQLEVTMSEYYNNKCNNNDYKEIRNYTVYVIPYRTQAVDVGVPYVHLPEGVCSQPNGKIVLVLMAGEQGTQIRDNIPTNIVLRQNQNRHHLAVSLYDSTTYRLRVQLSCRQNSDGSWSDVNCNLAQDVNVLIDSNNDGRYDESESRIVRRWPLHGSVPLGIYDFEIDIPTFDNRLTRSNSHGLRIVVKPSDEYTKKCGQINHYEERDYTINIIPKPVYQDYVRPVYQEPVRPVYQEPVRPVYQEYPRSSGLCSSGSFVCARGSTAIASVELSGEQNMDIRDDTRQCSSSNNYLDQSNSIVHLYGNTAYTMYASLFCVQDEQALSNGYGCNLDAKFGVWIDFNDDGNFDSSTEQVLSGYGYLDEQRTSDFRLNLVIPELDARYYSNGRHRMRIIMTTNEQTLQPCYNTGYGEARDYSVQILSRSEY